MASQLLRYIHTNIVGSESFVGNAQIGDYLAQRVFKPGSLYEWNAMLKQATREELNPEHFIAQFV